MNRGKLLVKLAKGLKAAPDTPNAEEKPLKICKIEDQKKLYVEEWLSSVDMPCLRDNNSDKINIISNVIISPTKNLKNVDPYDFHEEEFLEAIDEKSLDGTSIPIQPNKTVAADYYFTQQEYFIKEASKIEDNILCNLEGSKFGSEGKPNPPDKEDRPIVDTNYVPSEIVQASKPKDNNVSNLEASYFCWKDKPNPSEYEDDSIADPNYVPSEISETFTLKNNISSNFEGNNFGSEEKPDENYIPSEISQVCFYEAKKKSKVAEFDNYCKENDVPTRNITKDGSSLRGSLDKISEKSSKVTDERQVNFQPQTSEDDLGTLQENFEDFVNVTDKSCKDLCPICFEEVGHFARHLFRKHPDDETIKKILEMPLKSNDRRTAIISLRKKGNFILNEQKNQLKVVRAPNKCIVNDNIKKDNYYVCVHCLGFYKKAYLWRHKKICKANAVKDNKVGPNNHLSESQTFLATTGMLGNYLNKSRIKEEVFNIMRPDDISHAAKTDPLICLFGESYIGKHKRKQMNTVVSNKLRELARLKLALVQSSTIRNLMDVLKPECYEHIVAAAKIVSGYDAEKKTYKASSLALHYGTTLKFLCDVAKKAIITKNPLFLNVNRAEKIKQIKEIRDMINMHWCNDVSSLANKVLNEQKFVKPKLLPLTEDVQALNNYIKLLSEDAFNNLKNNIDVTSNYKILAQCTLVLVLVFNRKRVGEVQFLDIATYKNTTFTTTQEECLSSLTEFEKSMSATFKRVVVFGKGSRPVPILFTKLMQKYIDLLLTVRETTNIVPKSNVYLFANPDSIDRWMSGPSVLRKFANKCGATNPELLTSTRFRKQIATILQLMNFEKDEMEQIARFMGHTEKTHMEFYRLTEDVYQTAKVAKVLLLLNVGKGLEFKGKSLNEIEISEDVVDFEEDEKQDFDIEENEISNHVNGNAYNMHEHETDQDGNQTQKNVIITKNTNISLNDKNENTVIKLNKTKTAKSNRMRWDEKNKNLVLNYFKKFVSTKKPPKKIDCIKFINLNPDLFAESEWLKIKTLVCNTYRNK